MATSVKDIVAAAEKAGLTQKKMAKICEVSPVTVSRWKMLGVARDAAISRLQRFLESATDQVKGRKYLDEASLEDLAERARQLGFRITFTDIQAAPGSTTHLKVKKEATMLNDLSFREGANFEQVTKLCQKLIHGQRGATLAKEVLSQLEQGRLSAVTYSRLSRWVNPERVEAFAQPIAAEISRELYGREIERISLPE